MRHYQIVEMDAEHCGGLQLETDTILVGTLSTMLTGLLYTGGATGGSSILADTMAGMSGVHFGICFSSPVHGAGRVVYAAAGSAGGHGLQGRDEDSYGQPPDQQIFR